MAIRFTEECMGQKLYSIAEKSLNRRPKWKEIVKDLKGGVVVLALEANLQRGRWLWGRIITTFPGKDSHTRGWLKFNVGTKVLFVPFTSYCHCLPKNDCQLVDKALTAKDWYRFLLLQVCEFIKLTLKILFVCLRSRVNRTLLISAGFLCP